MGRFGGEEVGQYQPPHSKVDATELDSTKSVIAFGHLAIRLM